MTRGTPARPQAGPRGGRFPGLLSLCLAALLALAVLMGFAERLVIADVVQHARPQLALLALFCLGVALLRRRRRQALAALAIAALLGWPVVASTLPPGWPGAGAAPLAGSPAPEAAAAEPRRVALVTANIYIGNPEPEAMVERLLATDADVLVAIEFRKGWRGLAERLDARYPHRWRSSDVTVWSRFPAAGGDGAVRGRHATLDVVLDVEGRPLRLLALHAPRPPAPGALAERNRLFAQLGDWVAEKPLPTVVAGDFNATPWTPALRRLIDGEPLARARPAGGWYASWPAPLGGLGIPIDHLLSGGGAAVERFEVLDVPGSDHRGLEARIVLP